MYLLQKENEKYGKIMKIIPILYFQAVTCL